VVAKGPFPEVGFTSSTGMAGADSDSEAEVEKTEHVRKSSLPQQVKEAVTEVAKEAVNGVMKASNHKHDDEGSVSWKKRSVFDVS
jgi:hypothetical protein